MTDPILPNSSSTAHWELEPPRSEMTTIKPEVAHSFYSDTPADHGATPDYEILSELGRGGMGVVYRARQVSLNRLVALKMILSGGHASEQERARFHIEAEAVARLQHPHIVQIHAVGEASGCPFLALEFVEGGSLASRLEGKPWPIREAAQLVLTLAQAMRTAHECGIVHRDLKPANILLTAGGTPKITDFGLAKRLDAPVGQTQSGAIVGTPSYMAPEQAAGKNREIGPEVDVYALGAILYELLTGRPPFTGETALDTLVQVLEREPVPLRLLNPNVSRELETICLKCLEKDRHRRYGSVVALADDLDRFLRGESISVRSINVLDRLARTLERSHLGPEFYSWGTLLFGWAAIVFIAHLGTFAITQSNGPRWSLSLCYPGQLLAMGLWYAWQQSPRTKGSATGAEQQQWALWLGYILACNLVEIVRYQLPSYDFPGTIWAAYPFCSLLTGLAFFVLGGGYWGRCYAFGLAFFALAVVMPWRLDWASLEFGSLWTVALVTIGRHLRRLSREQRAVEPPLRTLAAPQTKESNTAPPSTPAVP